jgi:hypothetical protein
MGRRWLLCYKPFLLYKTRTRRWAIRPFWYALIGPMIETGEHLYVFDGSPTLPVVYLSWE